MPKIFPCTDLGDIDMSCEAKAETFMLKPSKVKRVIFNIPSNLSDEEIRDSLTGKHVSVGGH